MRKLVLLLLLVGCADSYPSQDGSPDMSSAAGAGARSASLKFVDCNKVPKPSVCRRPLPSVPKCVGGLTATEEAILLAKEAAGCSRKGEAGVLDNCWIARNEYPSIQEYFCTCSGHDANIAVGVSSITDTKVSAWYGIYDNTAIPIQWGVGYTELGWCTVGCQPKCID